MAPLTDDPPILDPDVLREGAGDDPDLVRELAGIWIEDLDARLPILLGTAARRDLDALWRLAHGLKGAAASVGARRTSEALRRLEALAKTGEPLGLEEALTAVCREVGLAREAMEGLLR